MAVYVSGDVNCVPVFFSFVFTAAKEFICMPQSNVNNKNGTIALLFIAATSIFRKVAKQNSAMVRLAEKERSFYFCNKEIYKFQGFIYYYILSLTYIFNKGLFKEKTAMAFSRIMAVFHSAYYV